MKKYFKIACICFAFISILSFAGCGNKNVEANFVRFNIGQRQNDYYLDFTINFNNKTSHEEVLMPTDFYIEINHEKNDLISFWYENSETYYAFPKINSNESLTLRIRVIAEVNNKEYNQILVKYKNKTLAEDNVYISNNNL